SLYNAVDSGGSPKQSFLFNTVNGFLKPEFEEHPPYPDATSAIGGVPRCGPFRARCLADSLWDLKESLRAIGSDLVIRPGKVVDVIDAIFQHFAADGFARGEVAGVWMAREETTEEAREQRDLENLVRSKGKDFRLFSDEKYFMDDRDLPFKSIQELPDTYSDFRKSVEPLRLQPRKTLPRPTALPPLPPAEAIPPLRVEYSIPNDRESFLKKMLQPIESQFQAFTKIDAISGGHDFSASNGFRGGESNGLKRLLHFIESDAISSYENAKNAPMGHEFTTKLSGYLAIGCIMARQIHEALRHYEDGEAANTPNQEQQALLKRFRGTAGFGCGENAGTKGIRQMLLWRDYFHPLARKHGNQLFALYGSRGRRTVHDGGDKKPDQHEWRQVASSPNSPEKCKIRGIFERFVVGRTGMSFIDASQRELLLTGYTSNRARQNVAFYLARLRIDWRLGAEWYECALVDYDPASNWGNWQYVAGVGNDPREDRTFNPVKQAMDYDSKGEYIKQWIPELHDLTVLDAQGNGDKQMLLKLYQPCNLEPDERRTMGLDGADSVEDPLMKIDFSLEKPKRNNQGVRGQGRGRFNSGGSWR
ncbi:putative cryptochrome DASH, mitochondrial, partial [Lachnellula willkommii]